MQHREGAVRRRRGGTGRSGRTAAPRGPRHPRTDGRVRDPTPCDRRLEQLPHTAVGEVALELGRARSQAGEATLGCGIARRSQQARLPNSPRRLDQRNATAPLPRRGEPRRARSARGPAPAATPKRRHPRAHVVTRLCPSCTALSNTESTSEPTLTKPAPNASRIAQVGPPRRMEAAEDPRREDERHHRRGAQHLVHEHDPGAGCPCEPRTRTSVSMFAASRMQLIRAKTMRFQTGPRATRVSEEAERDRIQDQDDPRARPGSTAVRSPGPAPCGKTRSPRRTRPRGTGRSASPTPRPCSGGSRPRRLASVRRASQPFRVGASGSSPMSRPDLRKPR